MQRDQPQFLSFPPSNLSVVHEQLARLVTLALFALSFGLAPARAAPPISPEGERLAALIDNSGVTSHWLAKGCIAWRSGDPRPCARGLGHKTHCSAYAAAIAERLGVYVLRPPAHVQDLLANAQAAWLAGPGGAAAGWRRVDALDAQALANEGQLVLAAWPNPNPRRPGHAAVVRPSERVDADVVANGPQIAWAGTTNSASGTTRQGFRTHPFEQILYYAHHVDWRAVKGR